MELRGGGGGIKKKRNENDSIRVMEMEMKFFVFCANYSTCALSLSLCPLWLKIQNTKPVGSHIFFFLI